MKTYYEEAKAEFIRFREADIIVTSGGICSDEGEGVDPFE